MPLRQQIVKNVHFNSRNFSITTTSRCLNSFNSRAEFHNRNDTGIILSTKQYRQNAWTDFYQQRNYAKKQSSGYDEFDPWSDTDDDSPVKSGLPTVDQIPLVYPRLPMIATSFPLFPKFIKVFRVN